MVFFKISFAVFSPLFALFQVDPFYDSRFCFQSDLKDFIEQKKIQAAAIYEQMMAISNFEKFTARLFSASFTLLKR